MGEMDRLGYLSSFISPDVGVSDSVFAHTEDSIGIHRFEAFVASARYAVVDRRCAAGIRLILLYNSET